MKKAFVLTMLVAMLPCGFAAAQDDSGKVEEKLYNFDDMLIDGEFRDPQGMFERARSEAQVESVLNLKRSFMPRVEETAQETSMRP